MTNKKFVLVALVLLAAGCNPFSKPLPAGAAKSVNGGVDWQFANTLKSSTTANLSGLSVSKLAFDPQNRQNVFLGSYTAGLYESQDAAATWSNLLSNIGVYDFVVSPQDSKTIYAAGYFNGHGRVLKTADSGGSWNQIYNEESANAVRAIALNPDNPSELVIGIASGDVIKSADGGSSWQLAKSFGDQVNRIIWQGGNIYVLLKTKGLFESSDFGATFTDITLPLHPNTSLGSFTYSASAIGTYSQFYVDSISPTLIYITTDKGLYKSIDGGKTWNLLSLPVSLGQDGVKAIAVAQTTSSIVYTSVGATIYKSTDGGQNWQTQGLNAGGFVNYILVDPQLPQIVYAGFYVSQ